MPVIKNKQPTYRLHKPSGRAVVTLDGRDHYLGVHGAPESHAEYDRVMAQWLAGGRRMPHAAPDVVAVNAVLLSYVRHCEQKYAARRRFATLIQRIKIALRAVREVCGALPAASFGPKAFKLVRSRWIATKLSPATTNQYAQIVRQCFRWAASEELVPPSVWHGLSAVTGLRRGDADVPEPKKIKPVPDAHVDAVLPYLPDALRAMVELQRLTGMRSTEVCIMRTRDIDVSGRLWVYRPAFHKTDGHGHKREVYIGPAAQAVLRAWLRTELDAYLFQPREAVAQVRAARHANRKTPLSCGNKPGSKRHGKQRLPSDHYDAGSYRRAIQRACDRADAAARKAAIAAGRELKPDERLVPTWHPHQLRHSFATRVRREHGIEAARVMLGHQHVGVTEIYAERDQAVAATVALKIG